MRVLWFSNTPANAIEYLNLPIHGGGWLKTLDSEIQEKIELNVAFFGNHFEDSFKYKNTNYNLQPLCIKKKQIEIKPYNRQCILVENIPLENTREYLKLIFSEYELIKYYIQTDKKTGIPKNSGIIELKNTEDYKKLLEKNTIEDMNHNTLQLIKYNII